MHSFHAHAPNNISFQVCGQLWKVTLSVNCQYWINFAGQICFGGPIMEGFILFLPRAHSQKKRLISFIVWWIPNRPINLQSFKPKECLQKADRGEAGQPAHALKNCSHIIRMKSSPRHRVSAEGWAICVGRMKPYLSLIRQLTVSLRTNNVVEQDIILCGDVFFWQEGAGPGIRRLFRRHIQSAIKVLRKPDVKVMTWNQHKWNVPSNWRWSWEH